MCSSLISFLKVKHPKVKEEDALDSFFSARREAIERTIVTDKTSLPFFKDVVGLDEVCNFFAC